MTDDLHDVLDRTADLAGQPRFDSDALWRQATRTRRRHSVVTAIGVCVVLAFLSLSVWWGTGTTTDRPAPPASTTLTPAMPSRLYNPPVGVALSPDLDTGPLAAVFIPSTSHVLVAVSAIDGSYRILDLPGYVGRIAQGQGLSPAAVLSPDGERLAYAWQAGGGVGGDQDVPGGVRLVDLHSGAISTHRVHLGFGPACGGLAWSANGRYLAYTCFGHGGDITAETGFRLLTLRLDTRAGTQIRLPVSGSGALVAVDDAGTVAVPDGKTVYILEQDQGAIVGSPVHRTTDESFDSAGWVGNSGGLVMMGRDIARGTSQGVLLQLNTGTRSAPARHLDGVHGRVAGPVDRGTVAVWVMQAVGGQLSSFSPTSGLHERVTFEGLAPYEVSFASALLQRPTRDTPDPNALSTWDHIRKTMPYVALVTLLLLIVSAILAIRRRERMLRQA